MRWKPAWLRAAAGAMVGAGMLGAQQGGQPSCGRVVYANVVALDQPIMVNRLGSAIPGGMIYALARDVVDSASTASPQPTCESGSCKPGQVSLRPGKRPRPIVLRVSVGDCLVVNLTNLVTPTPTHDQLNVFQPGGTIGQLWGQTGTRAVGFHPAGLDLMAPPNTGAPAAPPPTGCSILRSDGDFVGQNCSSQAAPGQTRTYQYYAREEGHYLAYSKDDSQGATGLTNGAGQLQSGLFGSVSVEPANAEYYRSQVLQTDLQDATYVACSATRTTDCVGAGTNPSLGNAVNIVPRMDPAKRQMRDAGRLLWTLTMKSLGYNRQTEWSVTVVKGAGDRLYTPEGHPVINYFATYQSGNAAGQPAGTPVLSMLRKMQPTSGFPTATGGQWELVHSDLTAIITGYGADRFPDYQQSPLFAQNPASPDRREPFREFTVHYHTSSAVVQAFPEFTDGPLTGVLAPGTDSFGINYGIGGIGPEVLANRMKKGPQANCVECKFEEFFLSSWVLGDPAMLVDHPTGGDARGAPKAIVPGTHTAESASEPATNPDANANAEAAPATPRTAKPKATMAYFGDDPSNVYHSYMRDHVKFRISNVSTIQPHVHHQHAHQWLQTPNSDDSQYLDSQMIIPGSTYTLEMVYNGSGNRNQTVGDSIFHCHFYPHFAGGMWALWRVHDVFEAGTTLNRDGSVAKVPNNRALPDGEIESGTPIPAVVPLPSLGMAPLPALISLTDKGTRAVVKPERITAAGKPEFKNPGFPFFIPGVAGHRAPHPPMDFAWEEEPNSKTPKLDAFGRKIPLDGGLPRHLILDGKVVNEFHTRWDFTKETDGVFAYVLPEDGTEVEKAAMREHARRTRPTSQPDGQPGNFILNGLPPAAGGPFARPDIDDNGNAVTNTRRYQAAVVQSDVVLNKEGWHYPQQRWLGLWNDVLPVLNGERPPQPLFFRANSGESIEYWHTNLVPSYYEMDDYQVRTPTDIIGQHIHLVKFDVLASDGAANGFNYEDGTFAPDEVRVRIKDINKGYRGGAGLYTGMLRAATGEYPQIESCLNSTMPLGPCLRRLTQTKLKAKPAPAVFGSNEEYLGAQTTIQLWDSDPLMNNKGKDRTLRTVFTHDHFGPSTHQNVGLYAGLLIEPQGSSWFDPLTGAPMGSRSDGGPTNWQANIVTANPAESYREFALEFADLQQAYTANSKGKVSTPTIPLFTQSVTSQQVTDYTTALNGGTVPAGLVTAFQANGITFSTAAPAKPKVTTPCPAKFSQYKWCIEDPAYPENTFALNATTSAFQAFTPTMHPGWADPVNALAANSPAATSTTTDPDIKPILVNSSPGTGTYSMNYRNEPLPLRVNVNGGSTGTQTDLAWAFASLPNRNDPKLNVQPAGTPISSGSPFKYPPALNPSTQLKPADPYTPLLSAYENDRVQIRTLVGAHVATHSYRMNGFNWLYEPDDPNSGFKSTQGMGLSEHFELEFTVPAPVKVPTATFSDYLYAPSSGVTGLTQGLWGLLRAYDGSKGLLPDLKTLPNNPQGRAASANIGTGCPASAPVRKYTVVAASPQQLGLTNGLIYNTRGNAPAAATQAAVYVNADDLQNGKLKPGITNIEPLILRANAGDCVQITLGNSLTAAPGAKGLARPFGTNVPVTVTPSMEAGLQADLVSFNVRLGAGTNVGFNQIGTAAIRGTAAPGGQKLLEWYAGNISPTGVPTPIEFGSIPLLPADPIFQAADGMIGTLVIEPAGSTWELDPGTRASATITPPSGKPFREFVVMVQNAMVPFNGTSTANTVYSVTSGVNYRSEPVGLRQTPQGQSFIIFGTPAVIAEYQKSLNNCGSTTFGCLSNSTFAAALKNPTATFPAQGQKQGFTLIPAATSSFNPQKPNQWIVTNGNYSLNVFQENAQQMLVNYVIDQSANSVLNDYSSYLSNSLPVKNANTQPQTPIFCASAGQPVRFRVVQSGGDFDHIMVVDGHSWKQEPTIDNSTKLGNNVLSQQMGTQVISANDKLDLLLDSAGGPLKIAGDYLYHSFQFQYQGIWGLFRVVPENTAPAQMQTCAAR